MEKTKEQKLMELLRKAARRTRPGPGPGPRHPGMPLPRGPHAGMHHGPGRPPVGPFPRERILLAVLESGQEGLRQKDIADELGINASSLSEQIDRLESERYLERKANPEDKRSTLISLTEKGRARAWEVLDDRRQRAEEFSARLSDEEKDALLALLEKLLAE